MKSGCARKPRVDGSTASLPIRVGRREHRPAMLPIGLAGAAATDGGARLLRRALTSSRPDLRTSDVGSIASPASYASTASLNLRRPGGARRPCASIPWASPLRDGLGTASALAKSPRPACAALRLL